MNAEQLTPVVSVLMTSYNRELYINEAIESVLASTYSNFELIIVDDCSEDKTYSIAKQYALRDKRIRVYCNEENIGQFPNRNKAASLANGTYLLYADSDDQIYRDGLERCMQAIAQFPEAEFAMFYDTKTNGLKILKSNESIRKHFFEQPFLTHGPGATIITRKLFHSIGGFPLQYSIAGDMYYNLNAACNTTMLLLPFRFVHYRIHEGQELNNRYDYLWANYTYLRDALDSLPLQLTEKEKVWLMNKNRRRFFHNAFRYLLTSKNILGFMKLLRLTNTGVADFLKAVFHRNI